ncbi:MAG: PDZ domain-containing protein [Pseudomonadota bacterium]
MLKLGAMLLTVLSGGFVAGAMVAGSLSEPESAPGTSAAAAAVYFDETAPVAERLAELERTVAEERDARLVLEEQITILLEEIDRIDSRGPAVLASEVGELLTRRERSEELRANLRSNRDPVSRAANVRQRQLDRLTEGGFAVDEAERILEKRSELQWDLIQSQHEARQEGAGFDSRSLDNNLDWRLRQDLGDAEYERYLEAMRQPTRMTVTNVYASSPASRIGLQPGDQIVAYNGQRVFSATELRAFTNDAGGNAIVDVVRDGTQLQLSVPAGPMGVQVRGSRSTINLRVGN